MWNLSAPFDTSERGDGEKWRTVLSSHPTPWGRELGQPCSCWSYLNAHQCPQLPGIQSSITCLPLCQIQWAALSCPGARHRQSHGSSAMWAKILLSFQVAATTGETRLFSFYLKTCCADDFASSFNSHCWKGVMKEEHYLIHVNAMHAVVAFTFCQGLKSEL